MWISERSQLEQLISSNDNFVLKCGASWCHPCKKIGLENFKNDFSATFAEVDIDAVKGAAELLKENGLTSIPYFMVWKAGARDAAGLQTNDEESLHRFLSTHLESKVIAQGEKKNVNVRQIEDSHAGGAESGNDAAIVSILESALSDACRSIRNAHSIDFHEEQALRLLNQAFKDRDVKKSIPAKVPEKKSHSHSSVMHIESSKHWKEMISTTAAPNGKPLVVDCWMEKCAPCKRIGPKFVQMADQFPNANFAKANVGIKDILAFGQEQGLKKIPFFLVYKDGYLMQETLQHSDENIVRTFITKTLAAPISIPEKIPSPQEKVVEADAGAFDDDFAMDDDF